jgi:hypothetical protein
MPGEIRRKPPAVSLAHWHKVDSPVMWRRSLVVVGVCLCFAAHARAEEVPRDAITRSVKVTLPFFGYTVIDDEHTQSTNIGITAGALFERKWLVEAGAFGSSGEGTMVSAFLRFGVTPALIDSPDIEGGWTLNAGPWIGYRYDARRDDDEGFATRQETMHSVFEGVGVDLVRWWPSELGLSLSLNIGLVSPFARSEDTTWSNRVPQSGDFHHGLDIRGAVGIEF